VKGPELPAKDLVHAPGETHLQALSYMRLCNSFRFTPAHSMHAAPQQQETG